MQHTLFLLTLCGIYLARSLQPEAGFLIAKPLMDGSVARWLSTSTFGDLLQRETRAFNSIV